MSSPEAPQAPGNTMAPLWRHPHFKCGFLAMSTVSPGIAAWGLVMGVAMIKSGLSLPVALFMSLVVFAGSAQLAVLPLLTTGAPMWVVWATALCVNLRFVIFSAQWRPYWRDYPRRLRMALAYFNADLNFVIFMKHFPEPRPQPEQLPFVWGGVVATWGAWQVATVAGMLLADVIPPQWGLGFAGTLALLGLTCSLLVDRAAWVAAAVAGCAAVAAYALPLKLNILVAIAAAVAAGLLIDHHSPRPVVAADDKT